LFDHYVGQGEQQRKRALESLKAEFTARIEQAAQKQIGSHGGRMNIDVESQPQFREEWRKMQTQLDSQYIKILDEAKQELMRIP
ncbi:MAG: hypothetical protein Q7R57_07920, partial [Dehalococcoidales bacterium]|nr:hypothetical protein [Dehalococcoidales bacterium]